MLRQKYEIELRCYFIYDYKKIINAGFLQYVEPTTLHIHVSVESHLLAGSPKKETPINIEIPVNPNASPVNLSNADNYMLHKGVCLGNRKRYLKYLK